MLILVLVIILHIKNIRVIDNTLRRQLLQLVNVVSCILRSFRSNLIAIQNTKALKHQGCSLRFTTSKIIKCLPYIFCHIFSGYLSFHNRVIRIFAVEILIKAQGSRQINGILEIHIPVKTTTQDFNKLASLTFVQNIKAGIFIITQIFKQLFAIHGRFTQISILIFSFTDFRLSICCRIIAKYFFKFIC